MVSKQEFITTFFRETDIPVAPSMERALGYFGVSRWVAFHRSRKLNSLCWADGRSNACRSASSVWDRFLSHPFVAPYLQMRRPGMNGIEILNFEANDDDPDLFPTLPNGEINVSAIDVDSSQFIEDSRKLAYAIVLDRAKRTVYITRWSHAFVFLMFYGGEGPAETVRELLRENELDERPFEMLRKMLREDSGEDEGGEEIDDHEVLQTSDWDDEPLPVDPAIESRFLAWLDRRWNNPGHLYELAVQHCRYRQYLEALDALQRALGIRPESAVINWMTSQVYGALERWPEALEACQKAILLQTTTEKDLPVEALFMWQGQCFSKLSRHGEAIKSYMLVTDLKPDYVEAYHELGYSHADLGHYAEAAVAHEVEIKLLPVNNSGADEKGQTKLSEAYEALGIVRLLDMRLPEAEMAFRQAIGLNPNSLQAHAGLASVCKEMGNVSEAEKEQKRILELQGTPSSAREQR
jgi:Flp pilus assembly protein TadD